MTRRTRMGKLASCALVLVLGLGGCVGRTGPTYTITDDIDLTFDFGFTQSPLVNDLHGPYVRGAKMKLFAHSSDAEDKLDGWSIASSDPAVFLVGMSQP